MQTVELQGVTEIEIDDNLHIVTFQVLTVDGETLALRFPPRAFASLESSVRITQKKMAEDAQKQ